MSAGTGCMDMPGGSWRQLIRAKRQRARFRITLTVRGKVVVKEYSKEDDYKKWKEAFEVQSQSESSGIEHIETDVVYP